MPKSKNTSNTSIDEQPKSKRSSNWTVIQYDESSPENWRDVINDMHIEWIESPLHDKDLDAAGNPKKPHRHILLMFGSLKSYEQVKELTELLNFPIPKPCHNTRALVRYMTHMDDPNKAQYSSADIKSYGGVDLAQILKANSSERYSIIREMIEFIRQSDIREFQDLMDYAISQRFDDWFPMLCDNSAYIVQQYIKSVRHRTSNLGPVKNVDLETGEIID
jgi:hypothetical protein